MEYYGPQYYPEGYRGPAFRPGSFLAYQRAFHKRR